MAHSPPILQGPNSKRPRGILKNSSSSYLRSPPHNPVTVVEPAPPALETSQGHDLTERDLVLQNTLQNAGRRRSSSNQSRGAPGSRRHSHHDDASNLDGSPRLKWDEANLYLTEQERTPKMKIDEPKTPFAKGYDPTEDEAELRMLDADDIVVDEVDAKNKKAHMSDMSIPDLDIGEPSRAPDFKRKESQSPKQVVVKDDYIDGHLHMPGDDPETPEEEEKHKQFEEARKRHYEMRNVANLLGHPEYFNEEDDDGDFNVADSEGSGPNGVSSIPEFPDNITNGS